jgi:hypothetical protein
VAARQAGATAVSRRAGATLIQPCVRRCELILLGARETRRSRGSSARETKQVCGMGNYAGAKTSTVYSGAAERPFFRNRDRRTSFFHTPEGV